MPVKDSKYANESKIQSGKHEDEKVACHAICEPDRACILLCPILTLPFPSRNVIFVLSIIEI